MQDKASREFPNVEMIKAYNIYLFDTKEASKYQKDKKQEMKDKTLKNLVP